MSERRIERVARAICSKFNIDPDSYTSALSISYGWPPGPYRMPAFWQFYPHAAAALHALKDCLTPEYDSTRDQKREDAFVELD